MTNDKKQAAVINVFYYGIIVAAVILGARLFLRYLLPALFPFLIAYLVALMLNPLMLFLEKRMGIPRKIGAFLLVVLSVAAVFFLMFLLIDRAVEEMLTEYDQRRKIIVSGFNKLGLSCREPKGAFYAFPSIKSTGLTSEEFCERLLYSKRVALVPGSAFGEGGEGYVRASYCYSFEHIKEALSRIGEFLLELKQ